MAVGIAVAAVGIATFKAIEGVKASKAAKTLRNRQARLVEKQAREAQQKNIENAIELQSVQTAQISAAGVDISGGTSALRTIQSDLDRTLEDNITISRKASEEAALLRRTGRREKKAIRKKARFEFASSLVSAASGLVGSGAKPEAAASGGGLTVTSGASTATGSGALLGGRAIQT